VIEARGAMFSARARASKSGEAAIEAAVSEADLYPGRPGTGGAG
jgi:hypothetical protein